MITYEKMADFFHKVHLGDGSVLHIFNDVDHGDPHDHPWGFWTKMVQGGYTEEVFDPKSGEITRVKHRQGQRFFVPARHVHRIVELNQPVVVTRIWPGPHEQKSGFWKWEGQEKHPFRREHDSVWWQLMVGHV